MKDELNPKHPVTEEVREHWAKFLAAVMGKLGKEKITLELIDLEAIDGLCVVVHMHKNSVDLSLVTMEEGERLANEHGGK